MHTCCCIFIFVMIGLIQSSNEFKIYLNVFLEIYLEKEKEKSFSLPPLSQFDLLAQPASLAARAFLPLLPFFLPPHRPNFRAAQHRAPATATARPSPALSR